MINFHRPGLNSSLVWMHKFSDKFSIKLFPKPCMKLFTGRKRSLGQGNVLYLCHSVHRGAEGDLANPICRQTGGGLDRSPLDRPLGRPHWADPPGQILLGRPPDMSTSRQYASYWNAYLFEPYLHPYPNLCLNYNFNAYFPLHIINFQQ